MARAKSDESSIAGRGEPHAARSADAEEGRRKLETGHSVTKRAPTIRHLDARSARLCGISSFGCRGRRAERNSESIECVHQTDRVCEIGKFLIGEPGGSGFIFGIGNAGLGYACHGLSPGVTDRRKGAGDDRRNGASWKWCQTRIRTASRMRFFTGFCNGDFAVFRHRFGLAEALALDDDAIGTVA